MKLTMPPAIEDAILEILETNVSLDSCAVAAAGTTCVILAAARSSTFLATANVSTLLKEEKVLLHKTKKNY